MQAPVTSTSSSTVVVSGAAGFLGSHLVERFLARGDRVVGIDNFCTGTRENLLELAELPGAKDRFLFLEGDVRDKWIPLTDAIPGDWKARLSYVFHFASPASPPLYQKMPLETLAVNSTGLWGGLDFATRHQARLIFASTSEIYGDPAVSPQPESYFGNVNSVGPRACYDEAKRFGEALIVSYNQRFGTRHGFVRIFNTYGPRMNPVDGRVVINFLAQAQRGEALTVHGHGAQTRSFCFVEDLIDGIEAFARSDDPGPINLGNDREMTILELAECVRQLHPEKNLNLQNVEAAIDDPKRRRPDLRRAREKLGWSPKVPLEDGLRRMAEWLVKRNA